MKLDPWQEEVLAHEGDLLLNTPRQIGKTTIMATKAARFMLNNSGAKIIVVSLTEDQAQLMIVMILTYLEQHHKKHIAKGKHKPTKSKIWLTNKSSVIARPVGNTGDAVRGFTGDILIVDEASRMPEFMWKAAKPTLATTGGKIWMCSTPFGKKGYFYECWLNKNERFKVIYPGTAEEVYSEREWGNEQLREESLKFIADEKKDMTALEFGQEYEGRFVDDLQQLFPDELIRKAMSITTPEGRHKGRNYYLGVDIARMGDDESTFEVLRRTNTGLVHIENTITKKNLLTQTFDVIKRMDMAYDFRRIYVDDEGIGIGVFDMLITDEQTRRKTEALRNSKKIIDYKNDKKTRMQKQDLYLNMLALMERGHIKLINDENVFQSFKSVQYEHIKDKSGKNFFHIFGNYTHIVEGLIRAAWCVKSKDLNIWISSI